MGGRRGATARTECRRREKRKKVEVEKEGALSMVRKSVIVAGEVGAVEGRSVRGECGGRSDRE